MSKKTLAMVALLLTVGFCIAPLLAVQTNVVHAQGVTNILSDGSITGSSNIIQNGNLYTLTGDIPGELIVQKDNIIIDGAGFTVQGDSRGIVLQGRANVTVQNTIITSWGGYTIELRSASNCTINSNSIIGTPENAPPSPTGQVSQGPLAVDFLYSRGIVFSNNVVSKFTYGLSMDTSTGDTVVGNTFTNGGVAFSISNSVNCYFRNNVVTNCKLGISVSVYSTYSYQNDLDTSNTVDGKPIIYWLNVNGGTVPSNAAYIVLFGCANVVVPNVSPQGIVVVSGSNCVISDTTLAAGSQGVHLSSSSGILIKNCFVTAAQAIYLDSSSSNTISGCTLTSSSYGVYLSGSSGNVISGNNFVGDLYGIFPNGDHPGGSNVVVNNAFSGSSVAVSMMASMQIANNTFVGNDLAVLCYTGSNTITGNTFRNNREAVLLQSTSNFLSNNRFSNNTDNLPVGGANFDNNIDASNTLDGKPMYYWVSQHSGVVPSDAGFVELVSCTGVTVANLKLANQANGILLAYTSGCTIYGNILANNSNGIYLYASPTNTFVGNNFTANNYAVNIQGATAAYYYYTGYTPSSGNLFYGNCFVNNNQTLYDVAAAHSIPGSSPSVNSWDNGTLGNYWSGYQGVDINLDGIGDTPFNISTNNIDNYPMMTPVEIVIPLASPTVSPTPTILTTPTPQPATPKPSLTASPNDPTTATPSPTSTHPSSPTPSPSIPEFPVWTALPLILMVISVAATVFARRRKLSGQSFC